MHSSTMLLKLSLCAGTNIHLASKWAYLLGLHLLSTYYVPVIVEYGCEQADAISAVALKEPEIRKKEGGNQGDNTSRQ